MTYLLDANVLSYFLNTRREEDLTACAGRVALATVGEVRDELVARPNSGTWWGAWLAASPIEVMEIEVGLRRARAAPRPPPDADDPPRKG